MLRKILRWTSIISVVLLVAVQFVRPARTNPQVDESRDLQQQIAVPAEVARLLDRACYDCHSNRTRWPWYSNLAPVSWFVTDHVNEGRRQLNFSDWAGYDKQKQQHLLEGVGDTVRQDFMPLSSYTLIHRQAALTAAEKKQLADWADAARRGGEEVKR